MVTNRDITHDECGILRYFLIESYTDNNLWIAESNPNLSKSKTYFLSIYHESQNILLLPPLYNMFDTHSKIINILKSKKI